MFETIRRRLSPRSANVAAFTLFCVCVAGVTLEVEERGSSHKDTRLNATATPVPSPTRSHSNKETISSPSASSSISASVPPSSASINTVEIIGDKSCHEDVTAALGLLATKAPNDLQTVEKYIRVITCVPAGSGVDASTSEFNLGNAERTDGTPWLAGTILHDATHSRLYHTYETTHPDQPVPDDVWMGKKAEEICLAAQAADLAEIGAPQSQIDYVKNDAIKTGYWQVPTSQRTW